MARVRGRRTRPRLNPEVSLTPLIDTALNLLIIFMITTPMLNNSLRIELPKGKVKEDAGARQEMIVSLNKAGKMALDGKEMQFEDLISVVKKSIGSQKDKTVFVQADKATNYGEVINVVDGLKQVKGVSYVALATSGASTNNSGKSNSR